MVHLQSLVVVDELRRRIPEILECPSSRRPLLGRKLVHLDYPIHLVGLHRYVMLESIRNNLCDRVAMHTILAIYIGASPRRT